MKTAIEKSSQQTSGRAASQARGSKTPKADSVLQQSIDDSAAMQRQREQIEAGFGQPAQREEIEEEEPPSAAGQAVMQHRAEPAAPNQTGMPDGLKAGIETLSGMDMSAVRVHYNSSKPAQLNAHAYAQGNDIHLGAGQEKHLPHEAWHTVQQRQGRVRPTMELGGEKINDDVSLEREADVMGEKATQLKG